MRCKGVPIVTEFLVARDPQNSCPLLKNGFLQFEEQRPFKLTLHTSAIVWEFDMVGPLLFWLYNVFKPFCLL